MQSWAREDAHFYRNAFVQEKLAERRKRCTRDKRSSEPRFSTHVLPIQVHQVHERRTPAKSSENFLHQTSRLLHLHSSPDSFQEVHAAAHGRSASPNQTGGSFCFPRADENARAVSSPSRARANASESTAAAAAPPCRIDTVSGSKKGEARYWLHFFPN